MTGLLIKNAEFIITMDDAQRELSGADIFIKGPAIKAIGNGLMTPPDVQVIDGRSKLVLPGFVNTHDHMFQIFTRDLQHIINAKDLFARLRARYRIWGELDEEMVYLSALVGFGRLLKSGCTLSSDNYYVFPQGAGRQLIDAEIRAARELGIRFHPARGAVSPDPSPHAIAPPEVCQPDEEILYDFERLIKTYHDPSPYAMLRIALGPTNPVTSTRTLLRETRKMARRHAVRLHTHLSESPLEEQWCLETHNMRLFEYMEELGWVGPDVWFAHCLHLSDDEIRRMGEYACGLAHCPVSNARNNGGIAPIFKMLESGVRVGLGVDGGAGYGDLMGEIQTAMVLHRYLAGQDAVSARELLHIATRGGADVLGWDTVGSLEAGKAADLIMIDTGRLDFAGSLTDPLSVLVFFATDLKVDTTIVNGRVVVEAGRLTRVDEEALVERTNRVAAAFINRIQQRFSGN